jgi:hypothetical protein
MLTSSGIRARIARARLDERRIGRRYRPISLDASAVVVAVVGGRYWSSKVRDFSATGVSLVCPHPVQPGALFTIELSNAAGTFACTVLGRVVRVQDHPKGSVAGCAFTRGLNDDDLSVLLG